MNAALINTMNGRRFAVASIVQETNTFSPLPSELEDFTAQGLWFGEQALELTRGTNTEFAGAVAAIEAAGAVVVPVMRAWAMSGGILSTAGFGALRSSLVQGIRAAGRLDGLVLALHGALVAHNDPHADAALAESARDVLGKLVPIVLTHDLHANLTQRILCSADALLGYLTYPHVDQGDTGRRGAELLMQISARGTRPVTVLAKRPMLIPAEAQALADPPMGRLRRIADAELTGNVVDVSLFPVQPWLDVPELGFGVTVTSWGDVAVARAAAERLAQEAWETRESFSVPLHDVATVVAGLQPRPPGGPVLLVQSADSPTAGATADSATVIAALAGRGPGLLSYATVVDAPAVAVCHAAGAGATVDVSVGGTLDDRWSGPVPIRGSVLGVGADPVVLAGDSMTGQEISMGRWATIDTAPATTAAKPDFGAVDSGAVGSGAVGTTGNAGLIVLVTERPAPTFDPAGYRHVGLDPGQADAIVVRSATMYRAGFAGMFSAAYVLDLPGASTPRLDYLDFRQAPRPLYPVDEYPAEPASIDQHVDRTAE